jgi:hypothetical protein
MRTYRMVSANTHFEKWWFKTFFYSTAMAAYIILIKPDQFSFGSWSFVCLSVVLIFFKRLQMSSYLFSCIPKPHHDPPTVKCL